MGSNVMEPEDIAAYASSNRWSYQDNFTTICASLQRMHARGTFLDSDPLAAALPLLLAQFSVASAAILLASLLLRPLRQSVFVAQMLGGIMLGPSFLGRLTRFVIVLFPLRSFIVMDLLSSIGFMLYFFLVGLKIDPFTVKKMNKARLVTGVLTPMASLLLTEAFSFTLMRTISIEPRMARNVPIAAQAQSVLAFPTVASILAEFGMADSELGRTAMCSSIISGLFSFAVTFSMVLSGQSLHDLSRMISTIFAGFVFTVVIVFAIRAAVLWMIRQNPEERSMKRSHFVVILLTVFLTGFCSHAIGLHFYYGPLVLGMTLPEETPIGSALKEKLGFVTYWMFLPIFFLKNGLAIDVFAIKLRHYVVLQTVALVSAVFKFLGAFLASIYYGMPTIDAAVFGLVMVVQGLFELGFFKMMKKDNMIDNEAFAIFCASMLIITGCVTPILKRIYDPSKRYLVYKIRTVSNSSPDSALGILLCLHEEDSVPAAINVVEAFNPTPETPLSVCVLHLVELVGREKRLLIPHEGCKRPLSCFCPSEAIFKAFEEYERSKLGHVLVSAYTGVSPCGKMHDDVFDLSVDKRISLAIVPYRSKSNALLMMNRNFLDKAPCSVGILVDRGPGFELGSRSPYRVGLVFLGGDDDREAMAIGARMVEHPNINMTVFRLLVSGNVAGIDTGERLLDNEFLSKFRQSTAHNSRVTYVEEVIMDGSGTLAVIGAMEGHYELVLVGRNHDRQSPLLSGIQDFGENAELGAIGQIFGYRTTLLVVLKEGNESRRHKRRGTNSTKGGEDKMPIQGKS